MTAAWAADGQADQSAAVAAARPFSRGVCKRPMHGSVMLLVTLHCGCATSPPFEAVCHAGPQPTA